MAVVGKSLGTLLGTRLGVRLGTDLAPNIAASFSNTTFTNASARYLSYGSTSPSVTEFAGGTLATRVIDGKRFAQIESAVENVVVENQDLDDDDWTTAQASVSANDITDPLGTTTMDKLVEDSSDNVHNITDSFTPDGSSTYCISGYAKADERDEINIALDTAGFPDGANVYYDLGAGTVGTEGAGVVDSGIEDAGGGIYRWWFTATSDAAAATAYTISLCDTGEDISYQGDGSSGAHFWNIQIEIGTHPTSPIGPTEAAAVTRAKDQLYWPEGDVKTTLRGKITFKWIPFEDSTTTNNRYLFYYSDIGQRVYCYYYSTTDKIRIRNADIPSTLVESNALTFSRLQELTITVDPAAGSLTISGASAGDGTYTNTAWSTDSGPVWWGMTQVHSSQCNGLISEPY